MNPSVKNKFDSYPRAVREKLYELRAFIFDVAKAESSGELSESLKWGLASFRSKNGSPVRICWNEKSPETVSLFFNCNTSLVATFREIYKGMFIFKGNRELVLPVSKPLPTNELKACISMALRYHSIKKLPLLGA